MPYLHATLGASGGFFRSEAAIVSGEAAIVILTRGDRDPGRMTIAASPLTIAASLRKKKSSGTQGIFMHEDSTMSVADYTRAI